MSQHEQFQPASIDYSTDDHEKIHFKCSAKNNTLSKLEWRGTIPGNHIDGKVVWHNAQGIQSYKFSGTLK
jgi:hypothetical protein